MPGSIIEGIADALPSAAIAAGVGMAFGMPFLPVFGTALVLGGISRAIAPKPPKPDTSGLASANSSRLVTVRQPISYRQIILGRRRVGGTITFIEADANNEWFLFVVTWAGHACQEIEGIYFEDELIPVDGSGNATGRLAGICEIHHSLGTESGQPFPQLVARSAGKWIDSDRQTGCTKTYFALKLSDVDNFPNGMPNITALIKGANDVYDARTATRGYSANPSLCKAWYLEHAKYGLGADLSDEVNLTQLQAAANDDDDAVPLAAGGTEARYALNMAFDTSWTHSDVLEAMNAANAGCMSHVGTQWNLFSGVYEAPTVELDEDDLAGPIRTQTLVPMDESCNAVRATYTDPTTWQPTDAPAVLSSTYLAEDDNVRRFHDLQLAPSVTSVTQAQRLEKIDLLRTRQGETFSAPFKLSALKVIAGGTVALSNTRLGYASKAFEVRSFGFQVTNAGELVINLAGRETAAAIFDWSTSEEQTVDLAPNTNLPDPFTVGVPGAPVIVETQYETLDGSGVKVRADVSWAASADKLADAYQLRYKMAADADVEASWTTRAPVTQLKDFIPDIAPGVYNFAVRTISALGPRSAWSTMRKEIFGLNAAPADLTGVSIQAAGGAAYIRWDLHEDLFVREGGWIEWRHSESTDASLASWEQSFSIGDAVPGNNNQTSLPLKPGTYLGKARSQRGILSVNAAKISTKQASVLNFVNVNSIQEDSSFAGTHSNTTAPDGELKLTGTGTIDAAPDFDTITDLDSLGGIAGAGTYDFAAGFDFGSVQRVRLTSKLVGLISNVNDRIDARAGDIDDWADFDGTTGASADAYVEVRETDDDPASSPSWSSWKRLDSAEFQARGFDFRVQLLTADDSYNVALSQVRVTAAQIY